MIDKVHHKIQLKSMIKIPQICHYVPHVFHFIHAWVSRRINNTDNIISEIIYPLNSHIQQYFSRYLSNLTNEGKHYTRRKCMSKKLR